MQKLTLCILLLVAAFQLKAQYNNQYYPINIVYRYHRHYYYANNNVLNKNELYACLNHFKSSANELNRYQIHRGISAFFLVGFAVAYIIPNPTSIVFSIIGIPSLFIETVIARKHLRNSVYLYNHEINSYQKIPNAQS